MRALERSWYEKRWWRWLLWPLSLVYQCILCTRRYLYQCHFIKTITFKVPVVVVGNMTVGGTGKTPFCIALCDYLKKQGYRPGLVSRGYGGRAKQWPQVATTDSDPEEVGDEPVLLVQRTQCPMVVAPDRVAAIKRLLCEQPCDVVVSDDGLQHYRMGRVFEFVIVDGTRGFGNGLCLPAGPLRDSRPVKANNRAVIVSGKDMSIAAEQVYSLMDREKVITARAVKGKTICAITGIGNPERFFETLRTLGFEFQMRVFPDHYRYQQKDLLKIKADILVMTEKDAVKCRKFSDPRCYALAITAHFPFGALDQFPL